MDKLKNILKASEAELKSINSMLSKNMHELNNRLTVLGGQGSILKLLIQKDQLTPDKLEDIIQRIESSSQSFSKAINEVRDFYYLINNDTHTQISTLYSVLKNIFEKQFYESSIVMHANIENDFKLSLSGYESFTLFQTGIQIFILVYKEDFEFNLTLNEHQIAFTCLSTTSQSEDLLNHHQEICEYLAHKAGYTLSMESDNHLELFFTKK